MLASLKAEKEDALAKAADAANRAEESAKVGPSTTQDPTPKPQNPETHNLYFSLNPKPRTINPKTLTPDPLSLSQVAAGASEAKADSALKEAEAKADSAMKASEAKADSAVKDAEAKAGAAGRDAAAALADLARMQVSRDCEPCIS